MNNLNRKRLVLKKKSIFYIFVIAIISIAISIFFLQKKNINIFFDQAIHAFSTKFKYQYVNLEISGLKKVNKDFIEQKTNKYLNKSIFVLPLNKISNSILENNWIKEINLSTNYKDTLFINITEYMPIGIYEFNNRYFYFDERGKIIEELQYVKNSEQSYIIFIGSSSNLKARLLIKTLEDLKFNNKYKVLRAEYINKRRWNIFLENDIKLMLSENKTKDSLQNYLLIIKNLKSTYLNNKKTFDLRNLDKILIDN